MLKWGGNNRSNRDIRSYDNLGILLNCATVHSPLVTVIFTDSVHNIKYHDKHLIGSTLNLWYYI